jgi:Putative MetA-pathway of phenol degradation
MTPLKDTGMQPGKFYCFNQILVAFFIIALYECFVPSAVWAGPPFVTDDPEPVEYRHWEFYISSSYMNNDDGKEGTLPHLELNYGILTDMQLHILMPFVFSHPTKGPITYGLGDTEVGVKYRFVNETNITPQIGTFPIVHIPTGDSDRGLGSGHVPAFLPVWLQKSRGPWTTYGGGGYWINPGEGNKNFWQLGWLVQRDITKFLTVGVEIFYFSKESDDGRDQTGYNIGGIFNLSEEDHVLFSAGSDIAGQNRFSAYLGYQWTFGPYEEGKK